MRPLNYADLSTVRPFTIGEKTYTGDDIFRSVAFGGNLQQDEAEMASWIAFWGARVAEAKEDYDEIEMLYRVARDEFILDLVKNGLEGDDGKLVKINKTNAEVAWRVSPEYLDWWRRQNAAERAWNTASYAYEACLRKSNMLQSMTKLQTDEIVAHRRARQ